MKFKFMAAGLVAVCGTLLSAAPQQQAKASATKPEKSPWSAELNAGYRYNSRLAVPDLDLATQTSDSAFLLRGEVGYDLRFSEATSLALGYAYAKTDYRQQSAFDLDSHLGSLRLRHNFGTFTAGASYHHSRSDLGGRGFLDYGRASVFASVPLNKQLTLRGTYVRTEKDYLQATERDSTVDGFGADLFYRFSRTTTGSIGYLRERNDARADRFDFDANVFTLRFTQSLSLFDHDTRLRAIYRHEQRDYGAVTPSIGAVRDDRRNSLDLELEVELFRNWFASLEHEIKDHSSNLASADFSQNITTFRVGVKF